MKALQIVTASLAVVREEVLSVPGVAGIIEQFDDGSPWGRGVLKITPNLKDKFVVDKELLVAIDSELSAVASGRLHNKDELLRLSGICRRIYEGQE